MANVVYNAFKRLYLKGQGGLTNADQFSLYLMPPWYVALPRHDLADVLADASSPALEFPSVLSQIQEGSGLDPTMWFLDEPDHIIAVSGSLTRQVSGIAVVTNSLHISGEEVPAVFWDTATVVNPTSFSIDQHAQFIPKHIVLQFS